jgi:DNA polymerase-3 subunit chi
VRVEFYVLSSDRPADRLRAACQLAMKAWRQDMPVFLRCVDEAQCAELDEQLWRFRAESFVPHARHEDDPTAPVVLGLDQPPSIPQGLLINLNPRLSPHLAQFSRIIEIVSQAPEQLTASRENFRLYRQQGYDPQRVEL